MMETKTIRLECKALGEEGDFEGYASTFGNLDHGRDIVAPGAFAETLKDRDEPPAMLWQHNPSEVIGVWQELHEDRRGLYAKGQLLLDVQRAREAHALLRKGAIRGLSIGFDIPEGGSQYDRDADVRTLNQLNLWEISHVTFPMNPEAAVDAVKGRFTRGEVPSIRDLERRMRELFGMSRTQAKALLARGYQGLVNERGGTPADLDELQKWKTTLFR